jgi:hypothetical protein
VEAAVSPPDGREDKSGVASCARWLELCSVDMMGRQMLWLWLGGFNVWRHSFAALYM